MRNSIHYLLAGITGGVLSVCIVKGLELRSGNNAQAANNRIVEANEFRLVDKSGKVRVQLAMSLEGGVALFFAMQQFRRRTFNLRRGEWIPEIGKYG